MRILSIQLDSMYIFSSYSDEEKDKVTARRRDRREKLAALGIIIEQNDSEDSADSPILAVTEKQYVDILCAGIGVNKVMSIAPGGDFIDPNGAIERIENLINKVEKFSESIGQPMFNEKVEVHTPGMGLMLFNHVMLLEDSCSDALQARLDEGWKIIAACPQPNQRRPDYIMGRYDPERDAQSRNSMAARG